MRRLSTPIVSSIAILAQPCIAADMPMTFNHVSGAPNEFDRLAHEHLGNHYKVVDFTDREHNWTFPRGINPAPHPPVYLDGRCVAGSALVIYVISADGAVSDAFAAKSTSEFLGALAVQSMNSKRFTPGQLDGRAVSSVAATNVRFRCPKEHSAF